MMTVQEWLGENNTLGIDIWEKKYHNGSETFDEWLDRVSGGNTAVRKLIVEKKFLPAGRILANRGVLGENGKRRKLTYSNCYVITPPEDNIESIYECATKLARTYSYGGGCGVDLSKLSPRGAKVNNAAKTTTGPVSFMELYNLTTTIIAQNGRRGALMLSISCDHPDLEEFIEIKSDLDKINKANLSVRITDEFMEAIRDDKMFTLSFTREETGEVIQKKVRAKELFMNLCELNWRVAEPGILYWDRINNWNLLSEDLNFEYAGVNPCVTGDTLISTTEGEVQIRDLVGEKPYVYCMGDDGNLTIRQASKVWLTRRNAQLVEIRTSRGSLRCTPDHLIHTRNRGWVEAADLRKGDKITGLNRTMKDEIHIAVGLSGGRYTPEHRFVAGAFYDIEGKDVHHDDEDTFNNRFSNLKVMEHGEHSKLSNTGRHIEVIRDEFGRYVKKPVKYKRSSINQNCGVGTNWFVQSVKWLDIREDVYDMTVPGVHNFVANRMVVHNCAEEPLPAGGSCCLGSLNLSAFVTEDGEFDITDFADAVEVAIEAMNDILDEGLELHPLQEQRDSVRDWRQIGVGIMGLADMLIKIGVRYGSDESIDICNRIGNVLANVALFASADQATVHGAYPKFDYDTIAKSGFYDRHVDTGTDKIIATHGLRNSQLLCIAPTGSLSTMVGCSGGIEPIFANYYERKTESLHGEDVYYKVYTPIVKDYMEKHGITDDADLPDYFVTARDLDYRERIAMQAIWQNHIDASISSTVNVPNDFTIDDVYDLYMFAWEKGLKGVTIFREGCERAAVLNAGSSEDTKKESTEEVEAVTEAPTSSQGHSEGMDICVAGGLARGEIIKASDRFVGKKRTLRTGCGTLHCEAFFDPDCGELREVYLSKGSTGGCANFMVGLSRMISLSARGGIDIEDIVDQLKSCGTCPSYAVRRAKFGDTSIGSSCPVAVGNALISMHEEMIQQMNFGMVLKGISCEEKDIVKPVVFKTVKCPECEGELVFEGGCNTCKNCGWSKCD